MMAALLWFSIGLLAGAVLATWGILWSEMKYEMRLLDWYEKHAPSESIPPAPIVPAPLEDDDEELTWP